MCNPPANHTGCIVDVQGSTIVSGGMVAYSKKFDPAEMLRLVEELRAWCKERLAGYKVPKTFETRDDLPLLPIGKVDKQALRRSHPAGG